LFGGYNRYQFAEPGSTNRVLSFLASPARKIPKNIRYLWRIRKMADEKTSSLPFTYMLKICFFDEFEMRNLLTPEFHQKTKDLSTHSWFSRWFEQFKEIPFPENLMAVDMETYLPDDLLVKADISSMASSLEVRTPFLDYRLMEFAASLPVEMKIRNGTSKYLLKKYLQGKIPDHVIQRPKMGFGVPVGVWFRKELRGFLEDILLSPSALTRGYFKNSGLEKLIQSHSSGLYDQSNKLYSLLVLELWHQIFIDNRHRALASNPVTVREATL
jgi:asparagine synthase (glutamine-hydrolysing)